MAWHDLLFLHWAVEPDVLRAKLPGGLEIDTFDGKAWLSIVAFRMSEVGLRGGLRLPGHSAFPETNVRTYCTRDGKPGIWFFSLDATSRPMVRLLRRWYRLPYREARMSLRRDGNQVEYESVPTGIGSAPTRPGSDEVDVHGPGLGQFCAAASIGAGPTPQTKPGTPAAKDAELGTAAANDAELGTAAASDPALDHFLTERYCLYAANPKGRILRGDIHHAPYSLRPVTATVRTNRLLALSVGPDLPGVDPLRPLRAAFCDRVDAVAWPLRRT